MKKKILGLKVGKHEKAFFSSKLGILFVVIGIGIPAIQYRETLAKFLPIIFAVVIGLIVMMVVYLKIEAKYKK